MKLFKNIFSKKKENGKTVSGADFFADKETSGDVERIVFTGSLWTRMKRHRTKLRRYSLIAVGAVSLLLAGYLCYFFFHTTTAFTTVKNIERVDIKGTEYVEFGKGLIKYSPDGVSSINNNGEVNWSSTFSMQTPIIDVCKTTLAVAEQKGTQVYIYNSEGLLGQFQTELPIEKIQVASQGVVAVVLQDAEVTWVNYYDTKGNEIVTNMTSVDQSGYPLDIALSPDGLKIMISYLCVTKGVMNTKVRFYNFGTVGQAEQNNLVSSETYENTVVPKVIFTKEDTAVAFRDNGFSVFEGKQIPELKKEEEYTDEVISIFNNDTYFGLVFASDKTEYKYKMQIFKVSGEKVTEKYFDLEYKKIKLVRNQVILHNESAFEIYGLDGRLKFTGTYPKPIVDVISVNGFRKYMILTQESTDMIRLK